MLQASLLVPLNDTYEPTSEPERVAGLRVRPLARNGF